MSGSSIIFDDKKIKISNFYNSKNKKTFNTDGIELNKILVSKKVSYGKNNSFKYFIGYNDNDIIRPLFVKLPQMPKSLKCLKIIKIFLFIVLRLFLSHDKFVDNLFGMLLVFASFLQTYYDIYSSHILFSYFFLLQFLYLFIACFFNLSLSFSW